MNNSTPDDKPVVLRAPERVKGKLNRWTLAIVIIGILVVAVLFALIYYSTVVTSSKNFSYTVPADSQGSYNSLTVSDVDGLVTVEPWSQTTILINGTMTANGLGSSLSTITVSNSSNNGDVVFDANFPASAGILYSQTYSATINVFVPSTIRFSSVHISNVNGKAQLSSINSTGVAVTTVNGNVTVSCSYCLDAALTSTNGNVTATFSSLANRGSYNLTATNANVDFTVPSSAGLKLTATFQNGYIVCPTCTGTIQGKTLTQMFGSGSASVSLDSVNGVITITRT